MKRIFLALVTLLLISPFAISRQISEAEAFSVAMKYSSVIDAGGKCDKLKKVSSGKSYYAFNAEGGGFIIVSGDDMLTELVGYSKEGKFDEADMPENMRYLLDGYSEYLSAVRSGKILPKKAKVSVNANVEVGPLLTTKWNQDEPYNALAPSYGEGNCPTGCIATAMAQVMNFHKWPLKGTGSNSYSHSYGTSTVDFSQSIYDWNNMLDGYYDNPSAVEVDAVAKLMYDVAVSVNMKWGPMASSAKDISVAKALRNHFGYQAQVYFRDDFTTTGFMALLSGELDNNRPVVYCGSGRVGHSFVADGYDSNGFVHINWGWGGHYDGFFDISYLYPEGSGIGGGDGGYNMYQSIITAKPLRNGEVPVDPAQLGFYDNGDTDVGITINRLEGEISSSLDFYVKNLFNISDSYFRGEFGIGVFDSSGKLVLTSDSRTIRLAAWDYKAVGFYASLLLNNVSDGEYTVWGIYRAENQTEWTKIGTKYGFGLTVSNGKYRLEPMATIAFSVVGEPSILGKLQVGREAIAIFPIKNVGGKSCSGNVGYTVKEVGKSEVLQSGEINNYFYDSAVCSVEIPITFDAGRFTAGKSYEVEVTGVSTRWVEYPIANTYGPLVFTVGEYVPASQLQLSLGGTEEYPGHLMMDNYDFALGSNVNFHVSGLANENSANYEGKLGYMIANSLGETVAVRQEYDIYLPALSDIGGYIWSVDFSNLAEGEYKIYPVSWQILEDGLARQPMKFKGEPYLEFSVADNWVKFKPTVLELSNIEQIGTPELGGEAVFNVTFNNYRPFAFCGFANLFVYDFNSLVYSMSSENFTLDNGENNITVTIPLTEELIFADGKTYSLKIDVDQWICTVPFELVDRVGSFKWTIGSGSLDEIESESVTVGPVPAEDVLYIKGASVSKVRVYSILGALVASEYYDNLSSVSIDVSALSPGAYVLDIETANGIVRKRFIKK